MSRKIPLCEILVEGSTYQSNKLRKRLIKEKILEPFCDRCELESWMNAPVPLELDHVNGINNDHRLDNLRLLCPNCHAQTENYRGKNWGKAANRHHYARVSQQVEEIHLK